MSADLLAPLARLVTTADAIEGLRDLFAAEEPLDDIAARVADTAVAAIPNADAISITVLRGLTPVPRRPPMSARWNSMTSSTRQAGVRAWKPRGSVLRCGGSRRRHHRWPEFVDAAQRVGIRASLSVPLLISAWNRSRNWSARSTSTATPPPHSIRSTRQLCACTPLPLAKRSATPAAGSTPEILSPSSSRHCSRGPTSTWPKAL